jgi:hypothetical protein
MSGRRVVAVGVLLTAAAVAWAGGMRDLDDAWLMSDDVALAMVQPGPRATRWRVTAAHGRLYGLPDLPQSGLAVDGRWPTVAVTLRWRRLGRFLFREDLVGAAVMAGRSWQAGLGVDRHTMRLAADPPVRAMTFDLRVRATPRPGWTVDAWWPLSDAPSWQRLRGMHRLLRLTAVRGRWAAAMAIDRTGDGGVVAQGEWLAGLADRVAAGVRIEPWSGASGLVTVWRAGPVVLRSSHLAHPDLGVTHRWSVTW